MTVNSIRKKLFNYIEHASDSKIKAIYTLVEDDIENTGIVFTEDFKDELDRRYANYKKGISKAITPGESKERIKKLLATRLK